MFRPAAFALCVSFANGGGSRSVVGEYLWALREQGAQRDGHTGHRSQSVRGSSTLSVFARPTFTRDPGESRTPVYPASILRRVATHPTSQDWGTVANVHQGARYSRDLHISASVHTVPSRCILVGPASVYLCFRDQAVLRSHFGCQL